MSVRILSASHPASPPPWWKEITRDQWYALLAGKIGWALDAFDVLLYVFCLKTIMEEWRLTPATAGFMVSLTLFASAFGGILFGAVADRIGRKNALLTTVILFSLCSGLSGLARNLTQLAVARTLLGLGMGGEWASGALLVSETWPARHRGKAIGLMQGGWALGYIAAAVAAATVLPAFGWRVMFVWIPRPRGTSSRSSRPTCCASLS
jgi:MFS family permease